MPLTIDEKRQKHAITLQSLTAGLFQAIQDDDVAKFNDIREKLRDFSTTLGVPPDLTSKAQDVLFQAGHNLTDEALDEIAAIADSLVQAGAGLDGAIKIAESGKEELFFPALASNLSRAVSLLKTFKEAAEKIRDEVEAIEEIEDFPGSIDNIIEAIEDLKERAEAVM